MFVVNIIIRKTADHNFARAKLSVMKNFILEQNGNLYGIGESARIAGFSCDREGRYINTSHESRHRDVCEIRCTVISRIEITVQGV